jgi:hypothetical protein
MRAFYVCQAVAYAYTGTHSCAFASFSLFLSVRPSTHLTHDGDELGRVGVWPLRLAGLGHLARLCARMRTFAS